MKRNLVAMAAEVAEKAADILFVHGWIQGALHTVEGYCYLGAFDKAKKEVPGYQELTKQEKGSVTRMINLRLAQETGCSPCGSQQSLIHWNDSRAKEGEVEQGFRIVGKRLREKLGETPE